MPRTPHAITPIPIEPVLASEGRAQPPSGSAQVDGLLMHATQARHRVQQGFGAANRGMLYTARKEFLQALQIVAEAKDARLGRRAHMDSLVAGLTAIEEAEQIRTASTAVANVDLSLLIATHHSPVLEGEDVSEMLPLAVVDKYHAFAQEQLGNAAAGDPSGSMALYGLARIYEHLGSENGADRLARSRQSVALHEAALLAGPENHLAAHELGVVMARLGRQEKAIAMLKRSVQLSPSSDAYQNLAVVCRQAGRRDSAALAEQYAAQMAEREGAGGQLDQRVAWLEPDAFARTSDLVAPAAIAQNGSASSASRSGPSFANAPAEDASIADRLAAPLKALSPQSWFGSTRK